MPKLDILGSAPIILGIVLTLAIVGAVAAIVSRRRETRRSSRGGRIEVHTHHEK
jgi:hypothetical protein